MYTLMGRFDLESSCRCMRERAFFSLHLGSVPGSGMESKGPHSFPLHFVRQSIITVIMLIRANISWGLALTRTSQPFFLLLFSDFCFSFFFLVTWSDPIQIYASLLISITLRHWKKTLPPTRKREGVGLAKHGGGIARRLSHPRSSSGRKAEMEVIYAAPTFYASTITPSLSMCVLLCFKSFGTIVHVGSITTRVLALCSCCSSWKGPTMLVSTP